MSATRHKENDPSLYIIATIQSMLRKASLGGFHHGAYVHHCFLKTYSWNWMNMSAVWSTTVSTLAFGMFQGAQYQGATGV